MLSDQPTLAEERIRFKARVQAVGSAAWQWVNGTAGTVYDAIDQVERVAGMAALAKGIETDRLTERHRRLSDVYIDTPAQRIQPRKAFQREAIRPRGRAYDAPGEFDADDL